MSASEAVASVKESMRPVERGQAQPAVLTPGQRLPEEQDYMQAYENVREKYKGNACSAQPVWQGRGMPLCCGNRKWNAIAHFY